jgi:hypothetical protein
MQLCLPKTPFSYFHPNATLLHFICLANSPQFHRFIFLNVVTFRKEVAEKVGSGFELPTQAALFAPNAPKKSTNLQ